MPCPNCQAGCDENAAVCAACGWPLAGEGGELLEPLSEPFEAALTLSDRSELMVVESALRSADVPFLIDGEDIYDPFGGRNRPIRVMVPASLVGTARELLAAVPAG